MIDVFLDSGAFSADSQKTPIDVWEYMAYINENFDYISTYVVLDVIGNAEETWKNQALMESEGLNPLPVYHVEDPIEYLYKCLEYDYFALGGMAGGIGHAARIAFLDKCFEIICDSKGNLPRSRIHGFGIMSPDLITRYPFFSLDTASWVAYTQYGMILIPKTDRHGNYQYNKTPTRVFVTAKSPKTSIEGAHIKNMTTSERQAVIKFIEKLGFVLGSSSIHRVDNLDNLASNVIIIDKDTLTVETVHRKGISNDNMLRYYYNIKYFQKIANSCPDYPWPFRVKVKRLF